MSRFVIDPADAKRRLAAAELSPDVERILSYAIERGLRGDQVLWIDEPWVELDYDELETGDLVGLVVLTEPIELDEALTLSNDVLLGRFQPRDGIIVVFLAPVRCTTFSTVPDCVSVFAGGLTVEGIANFAAPDATPIVAQKLEAEVVLSGMGDSAVLIAPGTALAIGAFHGYLGSTAKLEHILPKELADRLEEESAWEVFSDLE